MISDWIVDQLSAICDIEYGTRVVRKKDAGTKFQVYGGGGATFSMDTYNRENRMVVARFAMSEKCTRFVKGKFFLNDSGLTLTALDKEAVNERFLNYQILSLNDEIYALGRGTAQKNLNMEAFNKITLAYPKSLSEQKQIVSLLDEAFEKIEQAKANIEKNIENAKELYENWLFTKINESEWLELNWSAVCDFTRGPFGGNLKKSMFVPKGYAVYEQKQAIHNDYDSLRYFITKEKYAEMQRFKVTPGNLLMSCSGVTLGRISEVPEDAPEGVINQALLKLNCNPEKILNDFLIIWIRSKIFQDLIFESSGGAAQPNVPSVKILKDIKVPCPPLETQETFIELHHKFKDEIDDFIDACQKKLVLIGELKKSILKKALTGKLTNTIVEA